MEQQENIRIIRHDEVQRVVGLSRSSIEARVAEGTFPQPVALGERSKGWIEAEVQAWLRERVRESRDAQAARKAKAQRDPNRWMKRRRQAGAAAQA